MKQLYGSGLRSDRFSLSEYISSKTLRLLESTRIEDLHLACNLLRRFFPTVLNSQLVSPGRKFQLRTRWIMVIFFGIEERPITLTKGKGTWGVVGEITHVFVSCSYGLWHRDVRSLGPTVSPIDNAHGFHTAPWEIGLTNTPAKRSFSYVAIMRPLVRQPSFVRRCPRDSPRGRVRKERN